MSLKKTKSGYFTDEDMSKNMLSHKAKANMAGPKMKTKEILKKNLNDKLLSVFRAEKNPDPNKHQKELLEHLKKKTNFMRNTSSNDPDATHNEENYLGNYNYDPSDPNQSTGLTIGSPLKSNFETPDNKTKPKNVMMVNPDQEHDPYSIFSKFDPINSPIKSSNKSGGKSKRRKSKTKSCCSVRKSAKVCRRKTDNKKFRLPRRFSRKRCLAKKPSGFTMRSSCAPYKGCNKKRKGGVSKKNKNGGHHELLLLASLLFAKKKSKTKSKTKKTKK